MPRSLALTTSLVITLLAVTSAFQPSQVARVAESAAPTVAGELVIEPGTLINLGFEWFIQGDANRNAAVAVSFRKAGETAWRPALPLLRLQGERVYAESRVDVIARDMDFRLRAGSAAVDHGVALPTITDGFNGRAPDLGALEAGAALPTYGPRPTSPR